MSLPARRMQPQPEPAEGAGGAGAPRRAERAEAAKRPQRSPAASPSPVPTRRRKKHHVGFAILAGAIVGSMVLGIVSLSALLAQQSFRIDEAEGLVEELTTEQLDLVHEQATLSAPGRIAAWARRNGMRLPDDIRPLHTSGDQQAAPAGAAGSSSPGGKG